MKQTLLGILALAVISCGDKAQPAEQPKTDSAQKAEFAAKLLDTNVTAITYVSRFGYGEFETGIAQKYYVKSASDSTKIDSAYALAIFFRYHDTINNVAVPRLDSLGMPVKNFLGFRPIESKWVVQDFNKAFNK